MSSHFLSVSHRQRPEGRPTRAREFGVDELGSLLCCRCRGDSGCGHCVVTATSAGGNQRVMRVGKWARASWGRARDDGDRRLVVVIVNIQDELTVFPVSSTENSPFLDSRGEGVKGGKSKTTSASWITTTNIVFLFRRIRYASTVRSFNH